MSSTEVVVTVCASPEDCDEVAALCGSSFPEEVWSQGLSVQEWSTIEAEDLRNTPSWWRQIGETYVEVLAMVGAAARRSTRPNHFIIARRSAARGLYTHRRGRSSRGALPRGWMLAAQQVPPGAGASRRRLPPPPCCGSPERANRCCAPNALLAGLARDGIGGRLLGVVVLTLEHEADDSISWSEYSSRVGCRPTILSWCYDQVLDEPLLVRWPARTEAKALD